MANKVHTKKKSWKLMCKDNAKKGFINDASGRWIARPSGNSMMRDYYPQNQG